VGSKVDPRTDRVEIDGKVVCWPSETLTGILHKPSGYVTSCDDPQGRPIVLDLLPAAVREAGVFPVGRLDRTTEGLLILTNDGNLAFRLAHPRYGVEKTYLASVSGCVEESAADAIRKGIVLGDGPAKPATVRILNADRKESLIEIRIHEGRKRQVRRMCGKIGHKVKRLIRTQIGLLEMGNLQSGAWRLLSDEEIRKLRVSCGLAETE
jgi:pseudouridine synthase